MSHIQEITLKTSLEAVKRAARKKGYRFEENATVSFYSGTASGLAVYLPGWKYPVVFDNDLKVYYDNWGGKWGDAKVLEEFKKEVKKENKRTEKERIVEMQDRIIRRIKEVAEKRGDDVTVKRNGTKVEITITSSG